MNLSYDICKRLRDVGFPQEGSMAYTRHKQKIDYSPCCDFWGMDANEENSVADPDCYIPTLSELISECGEEFWRLTNLNPGWSCESPGMFEYVEGKTPEEAVARLLLQTGITPKK